MSMMHFADRNSNGYLVGEGSYWTEERPASLPHMSLRSTTHAVHVECHNDMELDSHFALSYLWHVI